MEFVMRAEGGKSLCKHWMPDDGLHSMSVSCACKPIIECRDGPGTPRSEVGTIVRHRPVLHPLNNRYAPAWKFSAEDFR